MQSMADEVAAIAQSVWSMILGVELVPVSERLPVDDAVVGLVRIAGAWEGEVTLRCGPRLAARAASILFGVDPAQATPEQVRDVVGELANVLGGNIKTLLPQPCRLSLPVVTETIGAPPPERAGALAEVALASDGDALLVTVARASA